ALDVRFYAGPVGGRELSFELVPNDNLPAPTRYAVTAIPGPGTDAVPVRARMAAAIDHAGQTGLVNLPVSGRWLLEIGVDGPLGAAGGDAPVVAAPTAAAMPEWLAWGIGTLPLWWLLTFVAIRLWRLAAAGARMATAPNS